MKIKVKNTVNTKKVKEKTQRANLESIRHAVATIRKLVLASIRAGKIQNKNVFHQRWEEHRKRGVTVHNGVLNGISDLRPFMICIKGKR